VRRFKVPRGLLLLAVLALATGCTTTAEQIEKQSQIRTIDDRFKPYREYASTEVASVNVLGVGAKNLVARVDRKTGAATMLLQFQIQYKDTHRRLYETARNDRAELLPLTSVQRQGQCRFGNECPYLELFTVQIPEADLRAAAAEGYRVKVFARNGPEILIGIPKMVISNLLAQVDADRAGRTPAPAPVTTARKSG